MADKLPAQPIAHLYAPRFPHEPMEIIGNQRGLERLIGALIDAVNTGAGSELIYASDGTSLEVRATRVMAGRRPEEWRRSGSPCWDIDDPLVARILDLTEENCRLRKLVATLKSEPPIAAVDYADDAGSSRGKPLPLD